MLCKRLECLEPSMCMLSWKHMLNLLLLHTIVLGARGQFTHAVQWTSAMNSLLL